MIWKYVQKPLIGAKLGGWLLWGYISIRRRWSQEARILENLKEKCTLPKLELHATGRWSSWMCEKCGDMECLSMELEEMEAKLTVTFSSHLISVSKTKLRGEISTQMGSVPECGRWSAREAVPACMNGTMLKHIAAADASESLARRAEFGSIWYLVSFGSPRQHSEGRYQKWRWAA